MLILKILRDHEWGALRRDGATTGAPVDLADGFIHFSTLDQAKETAAKHFPDEGGLMLLAVEAEALGEALKWEVSRGGALFPHLYRDLRLSDLVRVEPLPLVGGVHQFPEDLIGYVDPTRPQFELFKGFDRDHPIEMLNLVRLRDTAIYPEGHSLAEDVMSGEDAYRLYGEGTAPIIRRIGASILWRGTFEGALIGPPDEIWDHVFIARYPSAHAFLEMVTDPVYREAVIHRQAAVLTSRLIRCKPSESGASFG